MRILSKGQCMFLGFLFGMFILSSIEMAFLKPSEDVKTMKFLRSLCKDSETLIIEIPDNNDGTIKKPMVNGRVFCQPKILSRTIL